MTAPRAAPFPSGCDRYRARGCRSRRIRPARVRPEGPAANSFRCGCLATTAGQLFLLLHLSCRRSTGCSPASFSQPGSRCANDNLARRGGRAIGPGGGAAERSDLTLRRGISTGTAGAEGSAALTAAEISSERNNLNEPATLNQRRRFRQWSFYAGVRRGRRLFRREGHSRPRCDRVEFTRHQHREGTGMADAASEVGPPIAGSPKDIRARGTDNG